MTVLKKYKSISSITSVVSQNCQFVLCKLYIGFEVAQGCLRSHKVTFTRKVYTLHIKYVNSGVFFSCAYSFVVDLCAECKVEKWSACLLTGFYWHNEPLEENPNTLPFPPKNVHFQGEVVFAFILKYISLLKKKALRFFFSLWLLQVLFSYFSS